MITRFTFALCILCAAISALAQEWHKGTVILRNQDVLTGEISYRPNGDAIFLKMGKGDAVMVFPAFRITFFSYYDENALANRSFAPLLTTKGAGKSYQFYEIIVDGEISVLRQQEEVWYSFREQTIEYKYFVVIKDELMPIQAFRKRIYPTLRRSSESIASFVHENKINQYDVQDNIRLIRFYNAENSTMASTR